MVAKNDEFDKLKNKHRVVTFLHWGFIKPLSELSHYLVLLSCFYKNTFKRGHKRLNPNPAR